MSNNNQKDEFDIIRNPLKYGTLLLWIGVPLVLLAPIIFTRTTNGINFLETGQIGDTIGGTTAPIIGLIGAILVYLALKAQIHANVLVQKQIRQQESDAKLESESRQLNKLYENMKSSIDNFTFTSFDPFDFNNLQKKELKGSEAFYQMFQDFYCNGHLNEEDLKTNPKITETISILEICDNLLDRISKSNVFDKDVLHVLTLSQILYRVFPRINKENPESLERRFCDNCSTHHGFPNDVARLIRSIKTKCGNRDC